MAKGRKPRGPKTLLEKIDTKYPQYSQEVLGLTVQQLDKRIADMQKTLEDASTFHDEKNGEAIKGLRDQLKELNASYNEVKVAVALKTKFLVSLIREKGGQ